MIKVVMAIAGLVFLFPVLAQSPPQAPPAAGETLERAWSAYRSADYPKALQLAMEVRQVSPSDLSAAELWGRACLASGEPSRAISALSTLAAQRGTVQDCRLLSLAYSLSGRAKEASEALARAEQGKSPTPDTLYALAWLKPDAAGRLALLKRIAQEFPSSAPALAPEITFWESKGGAVLRSPTQPLLPDGFQVKLKTLYDMEWAVCRVASGEELWLLVDTSSRQTVLSRDTAERLKLPVIQAAYPMAGAYPNEPAPAYTMLDALDLGGYKVQNIPALVVEDSQEVLRYREGRAVLKGILGMDLLRGLRVRFDRQRSVLALFPPEVPMEKLLDGKPAEWHEFPAFSVYDQVMVRSAMGSKSPILALFATGCSFVLAVAPALPGSGLEADSKNLVTLDFKNFDVPMNPMGVNATGQNKIRPRVMGWLSECVPPVGTVRTVPKDASIGFAGDSFVFRGLPVYPNPLGGDIPACVVIGRKVTDFFAIALDLSSGKLYAKQVLN